MTNDNDDETKKAFILGIIEERVNYFYKQGTVVHISKYDGHIHNGLIILVEPTFLILLDERRGDIPIFLKEIYRIDKREEKR